jgi:hypothetical protein
LQTTSRYKSAYAELLDTNYTLLEIKQAEDIPSGAVSYSGVLEFADLKKVIGARTTNGTPFDI